MYNFSISVVATAGVREDAIELGDEDADEDEAERVREF